MRIGCLPFLSSFAFLDNENWSNFEFQLNSMLIRIEMRLKDVGVRILCSFSATNITRLTARVFDAYTIFIFIFRMFKVHIQRKKINWGTKFWWTSNKRAEFLQLPKVNWGPNKQHSAANANEAISPGSGRPITSIISCWIQCLIDYLTFDFSTFPSTSLSELALRCCCVLVELNIMCIKSKKYPAASQTAHTDSIQIVVNMEAWCLFHNEFRFSICSSCRRRVKPAVCEHSHAEQRACRRKNCLIQISQKFNFSTTPVFQQFSSRCVGFLYESRDHSSQGGGDIEPSFTKTVASSLKEDWKSSEKNLFHPQQKRKKPTLRRPFITCQTMTLKFQGWDENIKLKKWKCGANSLSFLLRASSRCFLIPVLSTHRMSDIFQFDSIKWNEIR